MRVLLVSEGSHEGHPAEENPQALRALLLPNEGGLSQADLNNVTAAILRIGSASAGSIAVTAAITDVGTGWTTLSLIAAPGGTITESAGATLTVVNLQAAGLGGVTLDENNAVSTLAGASDAAFSFVDTLSLAVDNGDNGLGIGFGIGIIGGGPVSLTVNTAGDSLTVNQPIDTTHFGGNGANVNLTADNITLNAAVNAGTATANVKPQTAGRVIDLGGFAAAGTLGLSDAELAEITAGVLRIGSATAGDITLTGNVTAHAGYNTLSLLTGGGVGRTASQTLQVTNLAVQASTGIGSVSDLLTAVVNWQMQNIAGAVQVSNTGNLNVPAAGIDGVVGVSCGLGTVLLSTTGSLTVPTGASIAASGA